jgi:hypothetical protein
MGLIGIDQKNLWIYLNTTTACPMIFKINSLQTIKLLYNFFSLIPHNDPGSKPEDLENRINIHNWSYGRLIESISTQANKLGIAIAEVKQPVRGSPTEELFKLTKANPVSPYMF